MVWVHLPFDLRHGAKRTQLPVGNQEWYRQLDVGCCTRNHVTHRELGFDVEGLGCRF
jgi:hypothetical protein